MDSVFFEPQESFRDLLEDHHDEADELWVSSDSMDDDRSGSGYGEHHLRSR